MYNSLFDLTDGAASSTSDSTTSSPTAPGFPSHPPRTGGLRPLHPPRSRRNNNRRRLQPVSQTPPSNSATVPALDASGDPSSTTICVVGVGFVGESLVREFSNTYHTIGFDISAKRIAELSSTNFASNKNVELTTDDTSLHRATHFLISVPTLLRLDRTVNLDYVHSALSTVLRHARPGACIVIESSVSVGTTRSLLGPHKHPFHCGMSPERVDPGRTVPAAHEIPKIISGLTPAALKAITAVYSRVFDKVVPVAKPEVAEMTKLFENCYRMVNIAYVNEMSDACRAHGIDPKEMVQAAATKPYGFEAFWPGLGVGGHCIPVNPFYLFANNRKLPVLERATELMWSRPGKLARGFYRRCAEERRMKIGGDGDGGSTGSLPRILVVGVGFKPGQAVLSCSPGLSFAQTLGKAGCERLAFYDPLVAQVDVPWMEKLDDGKWNAEYLDKEFDGIAICTPQHGVDLDVTKMLQRVFVRQFSG